MPVKAGIIGEPVSKTDFRRGSPFLNVNLGINQLFDNDVPMDGNVQFLGKTVSNTGFGIIEGLGEHLHCDFAADILIDIIEARQGYGTVFHCKIHFVRMG